MLPTKSNLIKLKKNNWIIETRTGITRKEKIYFN